ncbi:hypothetical protein NEOLEDRAFT_1226333 [Neolentinus lepideus HHB14362 ss-1]|uniref:Uncharacterized protein n=1 Tax=Neolentinus lepideus HHB14362 ss-1 TaxID=1314782 RepID=A0A165PD16_9AGAM|nr:hypothetical protein NEOLEDRAFT_1226333 [Neolentinus lepideus HHB14362 ss-1]
MPSVSESECEADGTLSVSKFLSRERFFYRCKLIKKQVDNFLRHPLFLEIARASLPGDIERIRFATLRWMQTNGLRSSRTCTGIISQCSAMVVLRPMMEMGWYSHM